MIRLINRSLRVSTLFAMFLFAVTVAAKPMPSYADPIDLGDYRIDISAAIEAAFEPTLWTLTRESDALYFGKLAYKGYDIQVRISVIDNVLTMTVDSVTETGCGDNCADLGDKPAVHWVLSMRRRVAYELTLRIRDSLKIQNEA